MSREGRMPKGLRAPHGQDGRRATATGTLRLRWDAAVGLRSELALHGRRVLDALLEAGDDVPGAPAVAERLVQLAESGGAAARADLGELLDWLATWCRQPPPSPEVQALARRVARALDLPAVLVGWTHHRLPRVVTLPAGVVLLCWPHGRGPEPHFVAHELAHAACRVHGMATWRARAPGLGPAVARLGLTAPCPTLEELAWRWKEDLGVCLRGLSPPACLHGWLARDLRELMVDAVAVGVVCSAPAYARALVGWLGEEHVAGADGAGVLRTLVLERDWTLPPRWGDHLFAIPARPAADAGLLPRLLPGRAQRLAWCSRLGAAVGEVEDLADGGRRDAARVLELVRAWLDLCRVLAGAGS